MKNVLGLPVSTEFNKRIPKQKFYENIAVTPAMKKAFVEQIKIIYWRNKIAATTLNLAAGEQVTEIEVFEMRLSAPELATGKTAFKVDRYYSTDWLDEDDLPVHLDGLSLDAVYENFVRQIAGEVLADKNGTTLKESVEQQKQREQIEKQTATLEAKIRKEKQPKKKFELVQKLSAMKDIRERGK